MGRDLSNVQRVFISIEVGGGSLTWKGGAPDYFTSLTHQRYHSKASEAEINLTYAPAPGEDPNYIENLLNKSEGRCIYQYGRAGEVSHPYKGLIHDYSTRFSEGSLQYTLKLVSQSVLYNLSRIDESVELDSVDKGQTLYSPEDLSKKRESIETSIDNIPTANADIKENLEDYLDTTEEYSKYVLQFMSNIVSSTGLSKDYEFDKSGSSTQFKGCTTKNVKDMPPMTALKEIAQNLIDSEDPNKYFYKIVVDDYYVGSNSKGKIRLVRSGSGSIASFVFDWGNRDGDVLSWNPRYNGSVSMFNLIDKSKVTALDTDEEGNVVATTYETPQIMNPDGTIAYHDSDSIEETLVSNINWYEEHKNYNYEADLEVLGFIEDLEINRSLVEVVPMVNGKPHHSKGLYIVVGITDKINGSQGFTTTLSLVRYSGYDSKENGKYYIIKDDGTKEEVRDYVINK